MRQTLAIRSKEFYSLPLIARMGLRDEWGTALPVVGAHALLSPALAKVGENRIDRGEQGK
jgi:hypothetical protein